MANDLDDLRSCSSDPNKVKFINNDIGYLANAFLNHIAKNWN